MRSRERAGAAVQRYRLDAPADGRAEVLAEGRAIGQRIGAGPVRVLASPVTFAELADLAFTPIRKYGAGDPVVAIHLIRTLARIGGEAGAPNRAALSALAEQTVADAFRENENEQDRARVVAAVDALRATFSQPRGGLEQEDANGR